MTKVDDALAAIARIDTATTTMAAATTQNAAALEDVAADIKRLLEGVDVPPAVLDGLTAAAAKVEAVAEVMKAQAETLTGIGASVENPVPPPNTNEPANG